MSKKFILLTTDENQPVIVGLSNIASIMTLDPQKENSVTRITLNFARNKDLWPKAIDVIESFDEIKAMLGL